MRDNVDRVIQFMAGKRIKMAHITSKDILEGKNLPSSLSLKINLRNISK